MALETKEPQGKILFKRTDISTMKKDIKMLRELDLRKEQAKSLEPLAPKAPINAEAEKQRAFALKSQEARAQAELKQLEAEKEAVFAKEKQQLAVKQQAEKKALESATEKGQWLAERQAVEAKKEIDNLEEKNKASENQKTALQQKIAQTNDALRQVKIEIEEKKPEPGKPAPVAASENDRRKKFMEDIEAWANSDKK